MPHILPALFLQGASLVAALVHLALGGFVLLEDPRRRANRLFAFLCLTFFAWAACYGLFVAAPDEATADYWNRLSTLGWGLSPALLLNFFLVFTRRRTDRLPPWGLGLLYLPAFVICVPALWRPVVASGLVLTPLGWAEQMDPTLFHYWLYIVYYSVYCVVSLVILWRWGRGSSNTRERWRAWLMLLSGVCSLILATIIGYAQPWISGQPMPGLSHFALLVWSGGMALAIHKYRLLVLTPESSAQGILTAMKEAVLLLDPRHRVLFANSSAGRLLGWKPAQLVGRDLVAVGAEALAGAIDDVVEGRLSSPGFPSEHRFSLGGGPERLVSIRALPMADEFGQLYGVALIIDDITEQRQLQRRLERADNDAQRERMAAVGMLAASVAHEVNNPLGYVMSNLELVLGSLRDANAQGDAWVGATTVDELIGSLEEALDGADRVRTTVRDLGSFSHLERLEGVGRVVLTDVLDSALILAGNELRHRARVVKELRPLPPILANEGRLCQVFLNLLIHAAQSIQPGHANDNRVIVRTRAEGDALFVEIEDTGAGLSPTELRHVFDPIRITRGRGGLGLPVSLQIIESMGGSIKVHSEPGVGSRFVVSLPSTVQLDEEATSGERQAAPADFGEDCGYRDIGPDGPHRHTVLFVDDEPALLRAMARMASVEHVVEMAGSLHEAQRFLESGTRVDLVVTDLMMAEGSGMDLFVWISEHRPELAETMLFVTGGTFTDDASEFVERFADRVLRKPISRAALLGALERALQL